MAGLYRDLLAAGCGIAIKRADGSLQHVPCFAFVDDLVLLAPSAVSLRNALDIVYRWSKRVRMNLNIGTSKSCVMAWGLGRQSARDAATVFKLGSATMPRVNRYKYLGVHVSPGGSSAHHIEHMAKKAIKKTG